ncbi:MAG: hypothetical protein AAF533_29260 [Acidobacteriota bacterium]
MARLRPLSTLTLTLAAVASVPAAELIHVTQDVEGRVEQVVELIDAWDRGNEVLLASRPLDVEIRLKERRREWSRTGIELMLAGPWGFHQLSYDESLHEATRLDARGLATLRLAFDVDGDAEPEIVFIERELLVARVLDSRQKPIAGPFLDRLIVRVRYLDRVDDTLVQQDVEIVPDDPAIQALLTQRLPDAVEQALLLTLAEAQLRRGEYENARYRLNLVKEWAERRSARWQGYDLAEDFVFRKAEPDEPAALWIQAMRRIDTLPPAFRRIYHQ